MKYYIEYLDCKNKFRKTRKEFKTYQEALQFMIDTFDTVNSDFIKFI